MGQDQDQHSKLFAKVISRQQKSPLAMKKLNHSSLLTDYNILIVLIKIISIPSKPQLTFPHTYTRPRGTLTQPMISNCFESLSITKCKVFSALSNGIVEIFSSINTVKPVLSGHSKRRLKLVFKTDYCLMQVKSIAECSKRSILQYFRPSLSYHLSLRSLLCQFLSGSLRHVLLYYCTCA